MYCPYCGLEIYDHASLCAHCGCMISLPPELTEAEIQRLKNKYKESFSQRSRADEAIRKVELESEFISAIYGARVFALLIDFGLIAAGSIFISSQMKESREMVPLIIPLLAYFYFVFFTAISGRTIGKLIVGIRVIDENNGKRPNLLKSLGRTCAMLVSFVFLMTGFLSPFFDARNRAWHDILSGTRVIYMR